MFKTNQIPAELLNPEVRVEFLMKLEVRDGNPNGNPDMDNYPRVMPDGKGMITEAKMSRAWRDALEQTGRYELFMSRAAAERGDCLKKRRDDLDIKEEDTTRYVAELNKVYLDAAMKGAVHTRTASKKTKDTAQKAMEKAQKALDKVKEELAVTPEDAKLLKKVQVATLNLEEAQKKFVELEEQPDEAGMSYQDLGPFQISNGYTQEPIDVQEIKGTRMMSATGKDSEGNEKSRDFSTKFLVQKATYIFDGAWSGHIYNTTRKNVGVVFTPDQMRDHWLALLNGPELRRSSSSGRRWVSEVKFRVFTDDAGVGDSMDFTLTGQAPLGAD